MQKILMMVLLYRSQVATGARANTDFSATTITASDVSFDRNPRFISTCSTSTEAQSMVRTELPHNLNVNDKINILNVEESFTYNRCW